MSRLPGMDPSKMGAPCETVRVEGFACRDDSALRALVEHGSACGRRVVIACPAAIPVVETIVVPSGTWIDGGGSTLAPVHALDERSGACSPSCGAYDPDATSAVLLVRDAERVVIRDLVLDLSRHQGVCVDGAVYEAQAIRVVGYSRDVLIEGVRAGRAPGSDAECDAIHDAWDAHYGRPGGISCNLGDAAMPSTQSAVAIWGPEPSRVTVRDSVVQGLAGKAVQVAGSTHGGREVAFLSNRLEDGWCRGSGFDVRGVDVEVAGNWLARSSAAVNAKVGCDANGEGDGFHPHRVDLHHNVIVEAPGLDHDGDGRYDWSESDGVDYRTLDDQRFEGLRISMRVGAVMVRANRFGRNGYVAVNLEAGQGVTLADNDYDLLAPVPGGLLPTCDPAPQSSTCPLGAPFCDGSLSLVLATCVDRLRRDVYLSLVGADQGLVTDSWSEWSRVEDGGSSTSCRVRVDPVGDPDRDGIGSGCDTCPLVADPAQVDGDGDGDGVLCDCDDADPTRGSGEWYLDLDGDGAGDPHFAQSSCTAPGPDWAGRGGDCDDSTADVHPGAPESCDGRDQDCDLLVGVGCGP